jgi:hypothetical protein
MEEVVQSGEGWTLFVIKGTNQARVHLDQDAFEPPVKEGDFIWLTRKSNGSKLLIHENNIMEVIQTMEETVDAKFATGHPVILLKSVLNDDMFMFTNGNLYNVERVFECTGDNTCEHCKECPECASMHCDGHEEK